MNLRCIMYRDTDRSNLERGRAATIQPFPKKRSGAHFPKLKQAFPQKNVSPIFHTIYFFSSVYFSISLAYRSLSLFAISTYFAFLSSVSSLTLTSFHFLP